MARHEMATADPTSAALALLSVALTQHVSTGCTKNYTSAFKKYESFCAARQIPLFTVDKLWLCAYLLYIQTTVSPP